MGVASVFHLGADVLADYVHWNQRVIQGLHRQSDLLLVAAKKEFGGTKHLNL